MSEREIFLPQNPELKRIGDVHKLSWQKDGESIELLLAIADNKKQLAENIQKINLLNGSHPTVVSEIEDAYIIMSANETIELYTTPKASDSRTSRLTYLAKAKDKSVYVQVAPYNQRASIHYHEEEAWERYNWVRGSLDLFLSSEVKTINENNKQEIIPGKVKHQAVGASRQTSITIITSKAKEHIYEDFD